MKKTLKFLKILCFILFSFNVTHAQKLLETPYRKKIKKNQEKFVLNKVKTIYKCLEIKSIKSDESAIKIDTIEIHRYNKKGKLIEIKRFYNGGFRRIISEYDSKGRKTKEATYDGSSSWPMGYGTTWKYDTKSNLVEQHDGVNYKTVIPRNKPNEEHYFEEGILKRITKLFTDKTGLIYTTEKLEETKKLIDSTIYKLNSKQRLLNYKSSVESEFPTTNSYIYDKDDQEIETIYEQNFSGGGGFKNKIELNKKNLPLRLKRYTLDDKFLRSEIYFYEYYQ